MKKETQDSEFKLSQIALPISDSKEFLAIMLQLKNHAILHLGFVLLKSGSFFAFPSKIKQENNYCKRMI